MKIRIEYRMNGYNKPLVAVVDHSALGTNDIDEIIDVATEIRPPCYHLFSVKPDSVYAAS